MIPLIAILENGFDSFGCGNVRIYQIRKDSHHPCFNWTETWNHTSCMMNENFHLWKIKSSEKTKGSSTHSCALVKSTTKIDKTIRHDLLKFSKYGYTYKFKYNSKTLEKFQCMAERMRIIKLGRKIKVSPI